MKIKFAWTAPGNEPVLSASEAKILPTAPQMTKFTMNILIIYSYFLTPQIAFVIVISTAPKIPAAFKWLSLAPICLPTTPGKATGRRLLPHTVCPAPPPPNFRRRRRHPLKYTNNTCKLIALTRCCSLVGRSTRIRFVWVWVSARINRNFAQDAFAKASASVGEV